MVRRSLLLTLGGSAQRLPSSSRPRNPTARQSTESKKELLGNVCDEEENVTYHAIAGFGPDTPSDVIQTLVELVLTGDPENPPAASEALRVIGWPPNMRNDRFGS